MKNNKRPIHLDIKTIHFPITAVSSILHRISGIFLFIGIGPILWILKLSISSHEEFSKIIVFITKNNNTFKFFLWSIITVFIYHVISGIRQILIDFGYLNKTWQIGQNSVKIIFIIVIILSVYSGIFIWHSLK